MADSSNINAMLASSVQQMIADAPFQIGIGSGFRTREQQAALRIKNGCPDVDRSPASACRVPTARPGESNHEHGGAIDLDYPDDPQQRKAAAQWVRQNAVRYGLHLPVRGEDWHIERIDGEGDNAHAGLGDDYGQLNSASASPEDVLSSRLQTVMSIITGSPTEGTTRPDEPALGTETTPAMEPTAAGPTGMAPAVQPGRGKTARMTGDKMTNAQTIAQVGRQMGVPPEGIKIALATALVESQLVNVRHGDRDSLGLFQQRPSQGWGTPAQVMDPTYAATQFYSRLMKLKDWQRRPPGTVAQAIQRSKYPQRYAQRYDEAVGIFNQLGSA